MIAPSSRSIAGGTEASLFYGLRAKIRYVGGLWRFLRVMITPQEARELIKSSLVRREENFLRLAELGIYGKADSPFRKLLQHAGIQMADLREMVRELGLGETLNRLYDRGVYLTYDEMRGRIPVRREGLEFLVDEAALDNPLLEEHYEMKSSGSTGAPAHVLSPT